MLYPKDSRPAAHLDRDATSRECEEWRSVVAYDGYYEVSNHGRVRSLARLDRRGRRVHPRVMAQECSKGAYVGLSVDRVVKHLAVMLLVADAFLPRKPAEHYWYHKTDNVLDNHPGNILHGTWSTIQKLHYELGMISPVRPDGSTIGDYKREEQRKHDQFFGHFDGGDLVARVCTACLIEKPVALFMQGRELRRKCRECMLKQGGVKEVGKRNLAIELAARGLRRCNKCGVTKALDTEFYPSKSHYMGRTNTCIPCVGIENAANREYRKQWRERKKG